MRHRRALSPVLPGFENGDDATVASTLSTIEAIPDSLDDIVFRVEVTRSARRKRSVGAHLVGDVLRITIPSWMSRAEESRWVDTMSARYRRKLSADRIDLSERASALARRYDLPRPREIRWADDMTARWGSCTPAHRDDPDLEPPRPIPRLGDRLRDRARIGSPRAGRPLGRVLAPRASLPEGRTGDRLSHRQERRHRDRLARCWVAPSMRRIRAPFARA